MTEAEKVACLRQELAALEKEEDQLLAKEVDYLREKVQEKKKSIASLRGKAFQVTKSRSVDTTHILKDCEGTECNEVNILTLRQRKSFRHRVNKQIREIGLAKS